MDTLSALLLLVILRIDCVPGRSNTTSLVHTLPGVLYGQCSEICGTLHGYMPLAVTWCFVLRTLLEVSTMSSHIGLVGHLLHLLAILLLYIYGVILYLLYIHTSLMLLVIHALLIAASRISIPRACSTGYHG